MTEKSREKKGILFCLSISLELKNIFIHLLNHRLENSTV